jgi:hypothetical protein
MPGCICLRNHQLSQHPFLLSHPGSGHIKRGACRARVSIAATTPSSSLLFPSGQRTFQRARV